jgi:uncharacterized protein YeaO (DUF488 family)
MSNHYQVDVGRVYDGRNNASGTWVLVDRLWPRGVSKKDEPWDEWAKDVAPSTELRQWYEHDDSKYHEFGRRYRAELKSEPAAGAFEHLVDIAKAGPITLLTASKDVDHSDAEILRGALLDTLEDRRSN